MPPLLRGMPRWFLLLMLLAEGALLVYNLVHGAASLDYRSLGWALVLVCLIIPGAAAALRANLRDRLQDSEPPRLDDPR